MATKAILYRMVTEDHVCPFGLKALDRLEREGFEVEDRTLASRAEAEAFMREEGVETTPQVFIDGERVGGFEALRAFLGDELSDEGEATYRPIAAVFGVTGPMALAAAWATAGTIFTPLAIERFVAFSMCVLAILKLRDLEAFSNQFLGYDLLARRVVRYAYVYPFAEAFAGVGMVAGFATPFVAATALFIGSVGAVSVFKAVWVDGRELRCACVGGNSNVPLGAISLSENLGMVGMAIWMLVR